MTLYAIVYVPDYNDQLLTRIVFRSHASAEAYMRNYFDYLTVEEKATYNSNETGYDSPDSELDARIELIQARVIGLTVINE